MVTKTRRPGVVTIMVSFTTDDEAGAVYGAMRRLKHDGYLQNFSLMEDAAIIDVHPSYTNNVLDAFKVLHDKGFRGINAEVS